MFGVNKLPMIPPPPSFASMQAKDTFDALAAQKVVAEREGNNELVWRIDATLDLLTELWGVYEHRKK